MLRAAFHFMSKSNIRAVLLQIHSLMGLALAMLLSVIGLTGAMMSFEDEIQAALNASAMHVEVRAVPRLSPDELIARLQTDPHFGKVSAMTMASGPSSAVRIRFVRGESSAGPSSIYVDPYDAKILGVSIGDEFFATVRKLHRWLLLPGDGKGYGRQITGIVALGLLAMLVSGLVLRWPYRTTSIKVWLKPIWSLRGRGLYRSLHAVFGTWVLLIYVVMVLTGLWYAFDWYKSGAVWLLSRSSVATDPSQTMSPRGRDVAAPKPESSAHAAPLRLDGVWSTYLQNRGDHFTTMQMILPAGAGSIVRVRSWAHKGTGGDRDEFKIDAVSGRTISADIYADKTIGERALARVLDIHRGSILGWPGKLLFMLAAAMMPFFAVTGLLLYFSRRRHVRLSRRSLDLVASGK